MQLQIFTDDFEVCNVLGSKATLHKICGVYLSILNIPQKYRSKLDNIHLICLCNSDDLKTRYTDFNDVWRLIVHEISQLEKGIVINGVKIRGTIANLCFDNLGANSSLGFVESFNSTNMCRICLCDKPQWKTLCTEDSSKLRSKQNYEEALKIIADSHDVDYKLTKGVKMHCELNELTYFDIFDNMSVDITHDLDEGVLRYFVHHLFSSLMTAGILSGRQIKERIECHNYGSLNTKNIPSSPHFDKMNLNQTASQMLCLFRNLPFIFFEERSNKKMENVWISLKSLLKITQIVYSPEIDESDLEDLSENIEVHLENTEDKKAKHHLLTHYPTIMRKMGPLLYMRTIRYEGKHKPFKNDAHRTNNFINLNKTLAINHQQYMAGVSNSYSDNVAHGKMEVIDDSTLEKIKQNENEQLDLKSHIYETTWIGYNHFNYRSGLIIFNGTNLMEIEKILVIENEYVFLCNRLFITGFDDFLNSLKVTSTITLPELVKFQTLKTKRLFEKLKFNNEYYILADTLELKSLYSKL